MFSMHEALARERMREEHERSQRSQVSGELASARRWHRLELRAHAARRRHAQRADQAASSVAEASGAHLS
jgi:hypothetical protein